MRTYYNNEEQHLFDHSVSALWIAAKVLITLVVYSPLLFMGFAISSLLWGTGNETLLLFLFTGIFSLMLFGLLYFLKGVLIGCRMRNNYCWLLLWLLCVGLTCIFPIWLLNDPIQFIAVRLSAVHARLVGQILSIALIVFVYSKYQFHKDTCPALAEPCYKMGRQLICS